MKSRWLFALLLLVVFSGGSSALAAGWPSWPFVKKSSTASTKKNSSLASRLPPWKNPAPSLKTSISAPGRTARKGPSTLAKIVQVPKTVWDKTTSVFKSPAKKPARRGAKKKPSSIWPVGWFTPIEEQPAGPRSVTEWMKQPRLDP